MTKLQIEEFSKIELSYMESVRIADGSEQLRLMELFFYWMKRQINTERVRMRVEMKVIGYMTETVVSENQKSEFTFLQMAMITAAGKGDRGQMVDVEIKMREWIDLQLTRAANQEFKPKLKIVRNGGNNFR